MAELKTKKNKKSVAAFLDSIIDPLEKRDAKEIAKLMRAATKDAGSMWGTSIVGYGTKHLKYASGREIDWMIIGFSPRKNALTLYLHGLYVSGGMEQSKKLLEKLGPHKTGKACLYIKRLSDIDIPTLKKLIVLSVKEMQKSSGVF